ncbi:Flavodoxin/ferredoxin--NADP reductase [Burkholderiales bacterium]|nr:Flavodoxin/ferredoxin--NADP reductase [Burkholderiales bacterium]
MSQWLQGRVAARRAWTDTLHSVEVDTTGLAFTAGQFARLALPAPPGDKEPMIGRPYSFVNPPHAPRHEFYFNVVPGGPLSPRLAALEPGDPLWLGPRANGFFCVSEVPQADALWCLATGTGLGPFLSILRTAEPWEKFERVVLVHAVRHASALSYGDTIAGIAREHAGAFAFVPVVSREAHAGALAGRIPALIADGRLEARAGVPLTADNAHAMLCGNPAMVDDVQATLATRGMRRHRRKEPGHVTVETYW